MTLIDDMSAAQSKYQSAAHHLEDFDNGKDNYLHTYSESLINNRSESLGFRNVRLSSYGMIAEVYNREQSAGNLPVAIRNNGLTLSLIYAPVISAKALKAKAVELATKAFDDERNRHASTVQSTRDTLKGILNQVIAENEERTRELQLQADVEQMLTGSTHSA